METVKAKIKGTNAILEGCVCDGSFFVSVDHDIFERYSLDEVEICKDSLQVQESCKENTDSFTDDLEEAAEERARKIYPYEGGTKGLICENAIPIYKAGFIAGAEWMREQMMMKGVEKHCHTVEEWIEHIKNADALTKAIFSEGPYNVLYNALNRPYRDCYDAIKEFGELCYQTARQDMMKDAVEGEITVGRLPDDWSLAYNPDELHKALLKFKSGDKVKIIIVKQNDRPRD